MILEKVLILVTGALKKTPLLIGFTHGLSSLRFLEANKNIDNAIGDNFPIIPLRKRQTSSN